ncbi:hypothetical protein JOD26_001950 [Limosilactobacillus caviae]
MMSLLSNVIAVVSFSAILLASIASLFIGGKHQHKFN